MKLYIGTKVVNAKPMTRADYNDFRGWALPADENGADEGYLVEYTDGGKANTEAYKGYVSWSPKDVFERAYKTMAESLLATPALEPGVSLDGAKAIVATKTAPKVTEQSIRDKIAKSEYMIVGDTPLTICIITMKNGFKFLGKAAPASPENYDRSVGERYAYEDAFKQIWSHEGYLLRETLSN